MTTTTLWRLSWLWRQQRLQRLRIYSNIFRYEYSFVSYLYHIFYTNIFGYSFVLFFWYKYIRLYQTALKSCSGLGVRRGLLLRSGNNLGASSRFSPQGCSREGRELLMLSSEENRTKILTPPDWKCLQNKKIYLYSSVWQAGSPLNWNLLKASSTSNTTNLYEIKIQILL